MNVISGLRRAGWMAAGVALIARGTVCAHAQTVLFDFGNDQSFRGLSVPNPDTLGHYWNSFRTGTFNQNLVDVANVATTIDFGFSTPVATDSFNGPAGVTSVGTLATDVLLTDIDAAALGNLGGALEGPFDYVAGPTATDNRVQFEIQQLDPTRRYTLTFFGSHKFSTDDATIYSVYTDNTYTTQVASVSLNVQTPGSPNLHNRDMVATITKVVPQTSNILYVQFVGANGNDGYLNDMQLTAVSAADFNGDGKVNATDLGIWKTNFGKPAPTNGDADGDGDSDGNDFLIWQRSVNAPNAIGAAGAVPEPAGPLLAIVAGTGLGAWSRRRSR